MVLFFSPSGQSRWQRQTFKMDIICDLVGPFLNYQSEKQLEDPINDRLSIQEETPSIRPEIGLSKHIPIREWKWIRCCPATQRPFPTLMRGPPHPLPPPRISWLPVCLSSWESDCLPSDPKRIRGSKHAGEGAPSSQVAWEIFKRNSHN